MHFTRDLAVGLRAPIIEAERIKKEAGSVLVEQVADDEVVEIAGVAARGARDISRRAICQILRDRTIPFDDRVVAREALTALGYGAPATGPLPEDH